MGIALMLALAGMAWGAFAGRLSMPPIADTINLGSAKNGAE